MRIPLTSVQRTHLIKHETYKSILNVLAWSLRHLAFGTWPENRHDGTEFGPGENFRKNITQAPACQGFVGGS